MKFSRKYRLWRLKKLANSFYKLALAGVIFSLAACNNSQKTAWEYMPDMMDSPSVKAQEEPMRTPPKGTVPVGYTPYKYTTDQAEEAGTNLKNPLPVTMEVLARGQKAYDTYCVACHGPMGKGDGTIVPKFPMPPSLHSEKVRNWSDGRIFHLITVGQNLMPSYASQITVKDRWAIIEYVRAMQRSVNPSSEDVEALKKAVENKTYP